MKTTKSDVLNTYDPMDSSLPSLTYGQQRQGEQPCYRIEMKQVCHNYQYRRFLQLLDIQYVRRIFLKCTYYYLLPTSLGLPVSNLKLPVVLTADLNDFSKSHHTNTGMASSDYLGRHLLSRLHYSIRRDCVIRCKAL